MNITNEEYKIINEKLKDVNNKSTTPFKLNKDDKVFMFKNCKLKKSVFNKLLKTKYKGLNITRTYDISEATVIVFPDVSYSYFNVKQIFEYGNIRTQYYVGYQILDKLYEDHKSTYDSLFPNLLNVPFPKTDFYYGKLSRDISSHALKNGLITFSYSIKSNYTDITSGFIYSLSKDTKFRICHEYSIQQLVHNVTIDSKESVSDYNVKSLLQLLANDDINAELAITVIKNCNIESDAYELLKAYENGNMSLTGKSLFFKHVLYNNPKLALDFPLCKYQSRFYRVSDVSLFIKRLNNNGYNFSVDDLEKDFFASDYSNRHYSIDEVKNMFSILDELKIPYVKQDIIKHILNLDENGKLKSSE